MATAVALMMRDHIRNAMQDATIQPERDPCVTSVIGTSTQGPYRYGIRILVKIENRCNMQRVPLIIDNRDLSHASHPGARK